LFQRGGGRGRGKRAETDLFSSKDGEERMEKKRYKTKTTKIIAKIKERGEALKR